MSVFVLVGGFIMWKLWFWIELFFVVFSMVYSIKNGDYFSALPSFMIGVLAASYGYAYQKAIWERGVWKVLFIFQVCMTLPLLMLTFYSMSFVDTHFISNWLTAIGFMLFLVLLILPTYKYGYCSNELWRNAQIKEDENQGR